MGDTLVKKFTVGRLEWEVFVNSNGVFYTSAEQLNEGDNYGSAVEAHTLKDLLKKIEKLVSRKFKPVVFVQWCERRTERKWDERNTEYTDMNIPSYLREGTIKGMHRGNGNALYYWNDDKSKTVHQGYLHGSSQNYLAMTDKQRAEYTKLRHKLEELEAQVEVMEKKYGIDLRELEGRCK